ncbi:hypothetical protein [Formosa sp. S-31]|uniref:hypothetical protein n=1 Tax=Formosa sp. S-31 TaxID=2790949 RepID=UPI003EB6F3F6
MLLRHYILACLLLLFTLCISAQIKTIDLIFPEWESHTELRSTFVGDEITDYLLNANKGDKLYVTLASDITSCYFNVLPPGSDNVAIFIGQNEGNTCSLTLNENGTYKIRVYQMRSSARRGTKVNYTLSVSVMDEIPEPHIEPSISDTPYQAKGTLRAANGSVAQNVSFSVIRKPDDSIEIQTQNTNTGVKRIFKFHENSWICTNADCSLSYAKISTDEWELICNGFEKYYIPDVVIYGD